MTNRAGQSFQAPVANFNMQNSFVGPGPATTLTNQAQEDEIGMGKGPDIRELFKVKQLKINLLCSIMVWLHGSFNFFLITFYLKYFPGNIYINSMCFASADLIAYMSSGIVLKYFFIR